MDSGAFVNGGVLLTSITSETIDKELGNAEGWAEGFQRKDPAHGVATHVFAAFDPSLKGKLYRLSLFSQSNADNSPALIGPYLEDCHVADPYVDTIKPYAQDRIEADKLWKLSEELVGHRFTY